MRTEDQVRISERAAANAASEKHHTVVAPDGMLKESGSVVVKRKKSLLRRIMPWFLVALLGVGAYYGWTLLQFNQTHETTDDAQIDADISPVMSRLPAYVATVTAQDNQHVNAGDVLATLDAKDLQIKLESAEAAYSNALAVVSAAKASASAAAANIQTAEIAEAKAAADLSRDKTLLTGDAITAQQVLSTQGVHETAASQVEAVRKQAAAAQAQVAVAEAQAAQRKADVDNVKLQISYATITAPASGTIAKRSVEPGQFVQAGQPLMAVTPSDIWITANFKETQIAKIRLGAPVSFEVDAYPGVEFHGTVGSISPATGAKFALLPPDNASGNFVKVTQRIPVRIHVDPASVTSHPLRPGMSVDVTVTTGK
jgi:membrane fusion protein (multidrug efflux system)